MPTTRSLRSLLLASAVLLAGLTSCRTPEPPAFLWSLTGTVWKIVELDGEMVGAKVIPTLQLETGGNRVSASGGVNRLSGTYTMEGSSLSFSPLVSTRMAGEPPQMKVEDRFVKMLGTVTNYRARDQWFVLLSGEKIVARAQATSALPFPAH